MPRQPDLHDRPPQSPSAPIGRRFGRQADSSPGEAADAIDLLDRLIADALNSFDLDKTKAKLSLEHASAILNTGRMRKPEQPSALAQKGGLASWQNRRLLAYVDDHLETAITIQQMAGITNLSRGHFSRAFKISFGVSPHAFVTNRRLERAQSEMLASGKALCEIALDCGFADQAHFSRTFRRVVGASPSRWRHVRLDAPCDENKEYDRSTVGTFPTRRVDRVLSGSGIDRGPPLAQ